MHTLLLEDDADLSTRLFRSLGHEFNLIAVSSLSEARAAEPPDLLLLDLGLPDGDGSVLLHEMRASGSTAGVLVLTGDPDPLRIVELLEAGADDFLAKPFVMDELRARMRALLRRAPPAADLFIGDVAVLGGEYVLRRNGATVPLRRKAVSVLTYLAERPGRVRSRESMYADLWDHADSPLSNTVDVHVMAVRRALEWLGSRIRIRCVAGSGYALEPGEEVE